MAATLLAAAGACHRVPPPGDAAPAAAPAPVTMRAVFATAPLPQDPDDPAIWINRADPGRSLILGTMKVAAPAGALVAFGMDGQIRQTIAALDRPNNVDVEYGLPMQGRPVDIAVVTERLQRRLRIFAIAPDGGGLSDAGSVPVLEGAPGEQGAPMGIALYRRPADGAVFAIVAPKEGPSTNYLWQYRLSEQGGRIAGTLVRRFGTFSGSTPVRENEIEAVAVDDALGYVYYADEGGGIHKWHADPDRPGAGAELALFGTSGFRGDREGIGIYTRPDGTGYIICTDQLAGNSEYHVFKREGEPGDPHDHTARVAILRGGADSTDGIEVTSSSLGAALPAGALVVMNSRARNFLVYPWRGPGEPGTR